MGKKHRATSLTSLYKDETKFLIAETKSGAFDYYGGYLGDRITGLDNPKTNDISLITEDDIEDILLLEAKRLQPKTKLLNELWGKKQYCGYGIFVTFGGYIYEALFNNNVGNGFGMFVSPNEKVKTGLYKNFTPKGNGKIYNEIEGQLKFLLYRRKIDMSSFIGEEKIKKSQY